MAAGLATALFRYAVSRGANRAELSRVSGFDPLSLTDPDARLPLRAYVALMRGAQTLCADPALALHFGEDVDMAELSVVGHIGRVADRPAEGLEIANRFGRLLVDTGSDKGARFRLLRERGVVWLVDDRRDPNSFPELTESTFARMVAMARRLSPEQMVVSEVRVTHAAPEHSPEYERVLGVPVIFSSEQNALKLETLDWLAVPNPAASAYVATVLRRHGVALVARLDEARSLRATVEALVEGQLEKGTPSQGAIAGQLGLTTTTLYRRLKAEEVTFAGCVDAVRSRLARDYLLARKLSVTETTYRLGFSSTSAFARARKRWAAIEQ